MPPLIVNDVVQVTILGSIGGRPVNNVLHLSCQRPIEGNSASKAQEVLDHWCEFIVAQASDGYSVLGARYIDLDSETGDTGDLTPAAGANTGGDQTSGAPPNVSILVRKNVLAAPRGVTFRMFLPPPADGGVDAQGNLTSTTRTNVQTALNNFLTNVNQIDDATHSASNLVAVSYPRDDDGHIIGAGTAYVIQSYTAQTKVASQRRRNRG